MYGCEFLTFNNLLHTKVVTKIYAVRVGIVKIHFLFEKTGFNRIIEGYWYTNGFYGLVTLYLSLIVKIKWEP